MQDLHVRKQIVETAQLLANCYSTEQLKKAPKTQSNNTRSYSHVHHPISKWVKESHFNFLWTLGHARALYKEFTFRFDKRHFCETFIDWCSDNTANLTLLGAETEQPQCFKNYPHLMVFGNPVLGYRNYYKVAKRSFIMRGKEVFATWTNREKPEWF